MRNMTGTHLEETAARWAAVKQTLDALEAELVAVATAAHETLDFPEQGVRVSYKSASVTPDYEAWVMENVGYHTARSMGFSKVVVDYRKVMEAATGYKAMADFVDAADLPVKGETKASVTVKVTA